MQKNTHPGEHVRRARLPELYESIHHGSPHTPCEVPPLKERNLR
jgi:hypothetical protein